jgi:hypothetical protein
MKSWITLRNVLYSGSFALPLLAATTTVLADDAFVGAKVGDTVNVRSATTFLNNATLTGVTASNLTILSGLDSYSLPLTNSVVLPAQTHINIAVKPGDWVDVKSAPQVILKHALLMRMTSSNITVATSFGTIDLPLSNTVVRPVETPPQEQARYQLATSNRLPLPNPLSPNSADAPLAGAGDPVVKQILGKYSADPHYNDALAYYQSMMSGIQSGSVQLSDLVDHAEQVLGSLDQFQPERAKDPEFEGDISTLRDFVNRAKAGEKIEVVK